MAMDTSTTTTERPEGEPVEIEADQLDRLLSLASLDMSMVIGYRQAADRSEDEDLKRRLDEFEEEEERHLMNLASVILGFGGAVPDVEEETEIEAQMGLEPLQGIRGLNGTLQALKNNIQIVQKRYDEVAQGRLPEELRALLRLQGEDIRRQMEFLSEHLREPSEKGDAGEGPPIYM